MNSLQYAHVHDFVSPLQNYHCANNFESIEPFSSNPIKTSRLTADSIFENLSTNQIIKVTDLTAGGGGGL
jgi:hypothetical protein